jgi:uncharacterized damage-inducible protein DinB
MRTSDLTRMLAYLDWANDATLAGARDLPHDVLTREVGISFGSILGTLQHMLWSERIWFERWAHGADPEGYLAPGDLAGVEAAWRALAEERRAWAASLDDDAAERAIRYRHARDGDQSGSLGDLVLHVVTHASLHRGQVVGMMRQEGITPPATGMRAFMVAEH